VDAPKVFINIAQVPELLGVSQDATGVRFGAAVTLTHVIEMLKAQGAVRSFQGELASVPRCVQHPQLAGVGTILVLPTTTNWSNFADT
jgi:CO/xanthine dehydrogenase FAD-binding subunit